MAHGGKLTTAHNRAVDASTESNPFFPTVQHDEGNLHADKGLFFLAELKLQSTLFSAGCWLLLLNTAFVRFVLCCSSILLCSSSGMLCYAMLCMTTVINALNCCTVFKNRALVQIGQWRAGRTDDGLVGQPPPTTTGRTLLR